MTSPEHELQLGRVPAATQLRVETILQVPLNEASQSKVKHRSLCTDRFQWCDLRPSVLGQDRSQNNQYTAFVLVLQVWCCCVVKHGLVTLVVIMILKDTATFQILFIVSLFRAWNITTVEINSGVKLKLNPPCAFVYFRWSWFWSCYFGLGPDLKNLVMFTSLKDVLRV